jgi:hypothetical protein
VSTLLRPTGPLPPGVYWVRRLVVLVVVAALVAGLWWWLGGDDAPTEPAAGTSPPATEPATPSPGGTASPTTSEPTREPPTDCRDRDVAVSVTTDAETYPPGRLPRFTLSVENTGESVCRRDVGPRALELVVTSGDDRIWSSDDCNPAGSSDVVRLRPGNAFAQTVQWARVRSAEGCPADQPEARPGQYQVVARNLELISEPAPFTLE